METLNQDGKETGVMTSEQEESNPHSQLGEKQPDRTQRSPDGLEVGADKPSPKQKGLSLRAKATALATAFGVLPVLIVGGIGYLSADRSITQRIAQEKTLEVEQLSDRLSRFLRDSIADIKTVASIVEPQALANPSPQREHTREALAERLTTLVKNYRVYSNIAVYDLNGEVIVQSQGSAREANQGQTAYFQKVLQTGLPAVSEPRLAEGTELGVSRSAIYVAAPVQNQTGETLAVVAARMPIDFVGNAVLRTAGLRAGTTYRLVDSRDRVFQNFSDSETTALGTPISQQLPLFPEIKSQQQSWGWIGNSGSSGQAQFNAYAPVLNVGDLQWSVLSSTGTEIAFAPQRNLLQAIAFGTGATALIAAALGALLANRATTPIRRAAQAVEKLGQGELETRLSVRGSDELAVLGANINLMAERLQEVLATLRDSAEQLKQQNQVLSELARDEALMQGDAKTAARAFAVATARTLGLYRASIWLLDESRTKLTCLESYTSDTEEHTDGAEFLVSEQLDYLDVLERESSVVTEDLCQGEMLFPEPPADSSAAICALDVPIRTAGQAIGVLRCERLGQGQWQANEQTFATSVANLIALAIENEFLQAEVAHLLDTVASAGDGDLTIRARVSNRTTGLVADTFNRLTEDLGQVLAQVTQTAQQVFAGTNRLETMAKDVATNAEQQAESVASVLTLTEQAEQAALQASEQVESNNRSLTLANTGVEQGQGAVTALSQDIVTLQQGAERTVQQMKTLGEFVGLADQFVQEQGQIASLTQVLAMNASLVAARAAEQRDPTQFAVVAHEFEAIASQVGSLAQQTDSSLKTLEQRTSQIHKVVAAVDADVQNMDSLVGGFTGQVERSRQAFAEVSTVMKEVVLASDKVSQASLEIVNSARTSAQAMRNIADLAERTAQLSQGTLEQSERMGSLSEQLLASVRFFRLPDTLTGDATPAQLEPALDVSATPDETKRDVFSTST